MRKWNYETKEYELYSVPEDWYCPLYENDMDKKVNCACCGKEIRVGDGYTSQEIHTFSGFGYSVCEDCHAKERERRNENNNIDKPYF